MKSAILACAAMLSAFDTVYSRPLADAAKDLAKSLEAGCIVTGEHIGDELHFALAGKVQEAKGAAPEKILFEIGSISKVFTGLLLAQAVVEKKVTLETTIGSLLEPKVKFADARVAAITLKQLSTHTSGLPRLPDNLAASMKNEDDPYADYDEKLLFDYLSKAKLDKDGPHECSYSNLGVGLLGHLLGRVYQTPWNDLVVTKVCLPLGMKDTAVEPGAHVVRAAPHAGGEVVKPWHIDALAGAGALRSHAADMMKFGEAMLNPEKTPLKEAFAMMMTPQADAAAMGGKIGLGVFIGRFNGDQVFNHDGGTGGFCSGLQVIPAKGIVRVALINNNSIGGSAVISAVSEQNKPAPGPQKEIQVPADALKEYVGVYKLDSDARFTVMLHDGQLWDRLTGQPFLKLFAKEKDRFFYKAVAAEIAFNREDGAIKSLTLFQNGREMTARRTEDAVPAITLRKGKEWQPYAGEYRLMGTKKLTLTVRGDTLFAKLEGQPAAPVFETSPDRFEYDVVEAALVFTRDDKKEINGLVLHQNGLTIPAARVKSPTNAPKE
ncbi:MAG: serine hydrolase [Prosthecobacter sp.]|jgi:D-alanyl-D-alanine-carboxypeptidase/D-alanyl-D-alanine-endopeptidase|uniref:serine hydrolase n=1 Tax=Prosthecobacter sp. TaxID=1965333 RepID=UPI001A048C8E|nr:serine hydrolase [Prosthecobacter sp.]MBE2286648.1 serine hydrolase [Prosthecobacter sp.]